MPGNRLFLSATLLDEWVSSGLAELGVSELRVRGRNPVVYDVEEAARVVSELTGAGDPDGLVGRVLGTAELATRGAEVMERSMVLGERAYEVEPGFLASPPPPPRGAGRTSRTSALAVLSALSETRERQSDEDLLARYLIEKLE